MHGSMDEESLEEEERPQLSLSAVFPNELIVEIFSRLSVKPLMKFRCLNNSFKTLISDPDFVQKHLKKSARNPHLAVFSFQNSENITVYEVLTFPVSRLLENPSTTTFHYDHFIRMTGNDDGIWLVAGSCNGLICLIRMHISRLCLWNPSTRRKSEFFLPCSYSIYVQYYFGYDTLTETYKVVVLRIQKEHGSAARSMVKVFSLGDSSLRNIQCFSVIPLYWFNKFSNNGVYLSGGTINWLAVRDYFGSDFIYFNDITFEQYVILSLDLSTETHTQLLLPQGFDKVPRNPPKLMVLTDCLCFCHDFEETHFILWKMKDFGVQESWIQLYKISYNNFFPAMEYKRLDLFMLCLSENGDTLLFVLGTNRDTPLFLYDNDDDAFIYNCRDNRVKKIGIANKIFWSRTKDCVESLVSTTN